MGRERTREHQISLGEAESLGVTKLRKEPRFDWWEDGGSGDELSGRLESRAEKWLERAQEETGRRGGCTEKEV